MRSTVAPVGLGVLYVFADGMTFGDRLSNRDELLRAVYVLLNYLALKSARLTSGQALAATT